MQQGQMQRGPGGRPMQVINMNALRETQDKARLGNIAGAKATSQIVRSTLGPTAMLKMMLDPMGGIVITNDGHAILRELEVSHPAAKSIVEIARSQDEETGDGTTSVVILAGELLAHSQQFIERTKLHATVVFKGYMASLDHIIKRLDDISYPIDIENRDDFVNKVQTCLSTKFVSRFGTQVAEMAVSAVLRVKTKAGSGLVDIDIKRFVKVEKIPGGNFEDSCVLDGVMVNKDVTHGRMRRVITNPRILLLDSTLEYKKSESQTNVEIVKEEDFAKLLEMEEEEIQRMCDHIIKTKCNVVITEKGVSDIAQHFLLKAGITCIRRIRKTDNNRIARVCGGTIVNRLEEATEQHVGSMAKKFEVKKIGDEYFTLITENPEATACTILLRGASKDSLNEVERNLHDALCVARNICLEPKLLPGGGATEMFLAVSLRRFAQGQGQMAAPIRAVAQALEIIPKTLIQNCGANVIRTLTELRGVHAATEDDISAAKFGIDGVKGCVVDVTTIGVWDTFSVRAQVYKAAIECAGMIVRIDDVLSGVASGKEETPTVTNYDHGVNEDMNVD